MENGFRSNARTYELSVVAKFLYWHGADKDEIHKYIIKFCQRYFENFNEIKYFDMIQKVVSNCDKHKLVEIGSVEISKADLAFVDKHSPLELRKLIFAILCLRKINLKAYGTNFLNDKWSTIANIANLKNPRKIPAMLKQLNDMGLIRICFNGAIECIFDIPEFDELAFEVLDFDNIILYYINHFKGGYTTCKDCGAIISKRSGQQYCNRCSTIRKNQSKLNYYFKKNID